MTKYRIVKHNGKFGIKCKVLFFWIDMTSVSDATIEFDTEKEAEEKIREWQKWEQENGTVVKEL